jgi:hypothetical protein
MSEHAGDYPNAQALAQAASSKYDIEVATILEGARAVMTGDASAWERFDKFAFEMIEKYGQDWKQKLSPEDRRRGEELARAMRETEDSAEPTWVGAAREIIKNLENEVKIIENGGLNTSSATEQVNQAKKGIAAYKKKLSEAGY